GFRVKDEAEAALAGRQIERPLSLRVTLDERRDPDHIGYPHELAAERRPARNACRLEKSRARHNGAAVDAMIVEHRIARRETLPIADRGTPGDPLSGPGI